MTAVPTSRRSTSLTRATGGSEPAEVAGARLLLERLGVRPEDLLNRTGGARGAPESALAAPTIGEYLPRVLSAVSPGTRQAYEPYWRRIEQAWGSRRLDELDAVEVQQLAEHTRGAAVVRRNSRGGQSAAAHLISALRCLYQYAETTDSSRLRPRPRGLSAAAGTSPPS